MEEDVSGYLAGAEALGLMRMAMGCARMPACGVADAETGVCGSRGVLEVLHGAQPNWCS